MARYRVRDGQQLPHGGQVLDAGTIVELPRHVAVDTVVRDFVEEVDEAGNPVLAPLSHDFERYKPHEQVTLLRARLEEAQARVDTLKAQIAKAEAASTPLEPVVPGRPVPAGGNASKVKE